jgi:hypothetical protein
MLLLDTILFWFPYISISRHRFHYHYPHRSRHRHRHRHLYHIPPINNIEYVTSINCK